MPNDTTLEKVARAATTPRLQTETLTALYTEGQAPAPESLTSMVTYATENKLDEGALKAVTSFELAHRPCASSRLHARHSGGFQSLLRRRARRSTTHRSRNFSRWQLPRKLPAETLKQIAAYDKERSAAAETAAVAEWETLQTSWKEAMQKDTLMTAGDGYEANLKKITQIVTDYGGDKGENGLNEVREALNVTGAGNHPAIARFLMRIAAALPGEGDPAHPNGQTSGDGLEAMSQRWFKPTQQGA